MVKLLLEKGADKSIRGGLTGVSMCISKGETALEIAEMNGFHQIASLFKEL